MEDNSLNRWTQLAKYLANESTPEEERELEHHIQTEKESEEEFLNARRTWNEADYALLYQSIDSNKAFESIKAQMQPAKPVKEPGKHHLWMGVAASLAVIIMSWATWNWFSHTENNLLKKELIVAKNQIHSLTLQDGTMVDINGGSQFRFPEVFEGNTRQVTLRGEAFFNVASNKAKPFMIDAGPIKVKVVGTQFNVKAFDQKSIEVTVKEGIVEVSSSTEKVVLLKGYKALFDRQSGQLVKSLNNNPNFNAWKTRHLVFRETNLEEVAALLSDVYKIEVVIDEQIIKTHKLSASFVDQPIDYVLDVISRTFHLKYQYQNGEYHLSENN
jgi:ferric-dicitrate binding protein FerR (iron transport regulator)